MSFAPMAIVRLLRWLKASTSASTAKGKRAAGGAGAGAGAGVPAPGRDSVLSERLMAEKLLKHVYLLYTEPQKLGQEFGTDSLERIAQTWSPNLGVIHPRKKITVMIIGNHSAGKSSFINWYTGDTVQKTGVAVETQGFTVVTHGLHSKEIRGEGGIKMFPHIKQVVNRFNGEDKKAFVDCLTVRVSTSTERDFPMVDLIDTPGLVDGEVNYPFDVNRIMIEMAEIADMILVFLDPMGQALCSRTMNVVDMLNKTSHHDKMQYFLSKADTVKKQDDLTKVIVQITQNLSSRVKSTHGFNVPTLWIPSGDTNGSDTAVAANELFRLCEDIHKTIQLKVQSNLSQLSKDCHAITAIIENELTITKGKHARSSTWRVYRFLLWPLMPLIAILSFIDSYAHFYTSLPSPLQVAVFHHATPLTAFLDQLIPTDSFFTALFVWLTAFLVVAIFYHFFGFRIRRLGARSKKEVTQMKSHLQFVDAMCQYGESLQEDYVRSAQAHEYAE